MPVATVAVAQPQPKMPRSSHWSPKNSGAKTKKKTQQYAMPRTNRISSGTSHHAQAASNPAAHHAPKRSHRWSGRCSSHHSTDTPSAASVATAFTAPISATATDWYVGST